MPTSIGKNSKVKCSSVFVGGGGLRVRRGPRLKFHGSLLFVRVGFGTLSNLLICSIYILMCKCRLLNLKGIKTGPTV